MKIGPIDLKAATPPTAADRKGPNDPVTPTEPSARVALSSQAALAESVGSRGEFDAEKVARISQAIRDGQFQVNAEAIADKLIANARELLPRSAH